MIIIFYLILYLTFRCRLCNMFDWYVYGYVLQHCNQLGGILSVFVDEIWIALDQLRQSVEHAHLYASDQLVWIHQYDESGQRIFRVTEFDEKINIYILFKKIYINHDYCNVIVSYNIIYSVEWWRTDEFPNNATVYAL